MPGEHQHCPCNGVWLCSTCHTWVHAHPRLAQDAGFIVIRSVAEPSTVPVKTPLDWIALDCGGGWKSAL